VRWRRGLSGAWVALFASPGAPSDGSGHHQGPGRDATETLPRKPDSGQIAPEARAAL